MVTHLPHLSIFYYSERAKRARRASISDRSVGLKQPACSCRQLFILVLLMSHFMAKNKRSKNFVAIPVKGSFALGTLADEAVLSGSLIGGSNFTEDFYAISCDISCMIRDVTAGQLEPMTVGLAHGDYSDTEIKEHLDVKLLGPGNKIEQERARRMVRKAGVVQRDDLNATFLKMIGKGGSPNPRVTLKFVAQSAKALKIWVQNRSGAAPTTGAILEFDGTLYGKWIL